MALLEAMVLTLREKLGEEEARGAALQGEAAEERGRREALEGQRQELATQVARLKGALSSAEDRLAVRRCCFGAPRSGCAPCLPARSPALAAARPPAARIVVAHPAPPP